MNHVISKRWLANPNQGHNHFLVIYWRSYAYLIHYQSEDYISYNWSDRFFQLYRLLSLECLPIFEHVLQPRLNTCLFGLHSLYPLLTAHHSNIGVHLRRVTKLGMLTLCYFQKRPLNGDWMPVDLMFTCHQYQSRGPLSWRNGPP